jgi:hypothetical protein
MPSSDLCSQIELNSFIGAAWNGDLTAVKLFLRQHPDCINDTYKRDRRGFQLFSRTLRNWTALHASAFQGRVDVVNFLLQARASTDIPDSKGELPIEVARGSGQDGVVSILLACSEIVCEAQEPSELIESPQNIGDIFIGPRSDIINEVNVPAQPTPPYWACPDCTFNNLNISAVECEICGCKNPTFEMQHQSVPGNINNSLPIYHSVENDRFVALSKEVWNFHHSQLAEISKQAPLRQEALDRLQVICDNSFKSRVKVRVFGSCSTALLNANSDIDVGLDFVEAGFGLASNILRHEMSSVISMLQNALGKATEWCDVSVNPRLVI